jgi:hypothetical protein
MMTRKHTRSRLLIVVGALLVIILLRPFQNLPFIDDWVYAWPVEHFRSTGELRILEFSGAIQSATGLLGAGVHAAGVLVTALRISTFVLAVVSLWLLHRLIKALGAGGKALRRWGF